MLTRVKAQPKIGDFIEIITSNVKFIHPYDWFKVEDFNGECVVYTGIGMLYVHTKTFNQYFRYSVHRNIGDDHV